MCTLTFPISSAYILGFLLDTEVLSEGVSTFTHQKKILVTDSHAGLNRTEFGHHSSIILPLIEGVEKNRVRECSLILL